eukprot:4311913-Prymnesium_polylepis.1
MAAVAVVEPTRRRSQTSRAPRRAHDEQKVASPRVTSSATTMVPIPSQVRNKFDFGARSTRCAAVLR